MRSVIKFVGMVLTLSIAGCLPPPDQMNLSSSFDPTEAAFIRQTGNGEILGNAFVRQNGGGIVTCAGSSVEIIPETKYSRERVTFLYGSGQKGYRPFYRRVNLQIDAQYNEFKRTATCDSQGKFKFAGLVPGNYYVITAVKWLIGENNVQGGSLMSSVKVSSGVTTDLIMSP